MQDNSSLHSVSVLSELFEHAVHSEPQIAPQVAHNTAVQDIIVTAVSAKDFTACFAKLFYETPLSSPGFSMWLRTHECLDIHRWRLLKVW